ncbi:unnamed protein product, partial [marine sediment metagenome]
MKIKTLAHLFQERVKAFGSKVALRKKDFGIWKEVSWEQYNQMVHYTACGLISLGTRKDDAVSIIAKNRLEWFYANLAIMSIGARTVGIYTTNVTEQVEYIVKHSESKVFIAEDEEQLDKILECRDNCPDLRWIIVIDPKGLRNFNDPMYLTWDELIRRGKESARKETRLFLSYISQIKENDICCLMYTSG